MGLLKLADRYSPTMLEEACKKALLYTQNPSYKSVSNILVATKDKTNNSEDDSAKTPKNNPKGITRGAEYYRRKRS